MPKLSFKQVLAIIIASILNLPLVLIGTLPTNNSLTLPGDTTLVEDVIDIETNAQINGSYSSIYVISYDHATIFQSWIFKNVAVADVSEMPEAYLHFSRSELHKMGVIQQEASIMAAIVTSFSTAKEYDSSINLEYERQSLCIDFYLEGSNLRIGDEIIAINGIGVAGSEFNESFNNRQIGDVLTIRRNDEVIDIVLDNTNIKSFGFEIFYKINYETLNPQVDVKGTTTTGPSAGFMRTLALVDKLLTIDLAKGRKIAGTGTINIQSEIGVIGGIKQKVYTAFKDGVEVFFCPEDNYEEALEVYNTLSGKEKMALVKVSSLSEAVAYLNA